MPSMEAIAAGIELAISAATKVAENEKIRKFLCGSYADGKPRSITDAITGEVLSPRQKDRIEKEIRGGGKKKKKKKKKKRSARPTKFIL